MRLNPSKLFTIVLVFFMPLGVYSSGISTLSFADIALMGAFIICIMGLLGKRENKRVFAPLILFILYVLLNTMFMARSGSEWLRAIRLLFYLTCVALFSQEFFNYEYAVKVYRIVALFATAFLTIQFILYHTVHFYLPGYLPFLNVTRDDLSVFTTGIYSATSTAQRMRSIFQEPAHFASYVSGCLAILMMTDGDRYLKECIFFSVGLVLASSATGILVAGACWIIFYGKKIIEGLTGKKLLIGLVLLVSAAIFIARSQSIQVVITRNLTKGIGMSRFSGYSEVWQLFKGDIASILFGTGTNLYGEYLAGWSRMMYYFGLIGIILYIVPLFMRCNRNKKSRLIILFLFVMGIGTSIVLSGSSMLLLSFAISAGGFENRRIKGDTGYGSI